MKLKKGKTLTALTRGEIAWGDLRKGDGDNIAALKLECIARGLMNANDKLGWTEMKKKVQQQDKEAWINTNQGKEAPEKFPHFKQRSGAAFTEKDNK